MVESFEISKKAKQVVVLSEDMLAMAHQSQWLAFEETEIKRQKILTEIFDHDAITEMLPKIVSFMQQVLDYDNESIQLGEQARLETLQELSTIHSNMNALGAYKQQSVFEPTK